jgi:hypothetical protein
MVLETLLGPVILESCIVDDLLPRISASVEFTGFAIFASFASFIDGDGGADDCCCVFTG